MDDRAEHGGHQGRYAEIDLLRTTAILLMIVYHLSFDLAFFYRFPLDPLSGGWLLLQRVTANLFLLLVGISFAISFDRMEKRGSLRREMFRKYALRGIGIFACGLLVSGVTAFFLGSSWVRFGILHLIGSAILLLPFLMPLREGNGLLALVVLLSTPLLRAIPATTTLLLPLGISPPSLHSIDYFPLFPWLAPTLFGLAIGNALYNRRWLSHHLPTNRLTALLAMPGQHSLMIYLVHQPVLLSLLWLLLGSPGTR